MNATGNARFFLELDYSSFNEGSDGIQSLVTLNQALKTEEENK